MSAARENFRRYVIPGRCARCGARAVQAHHVIYEQELRVRRLPIWDRRNALPMCHRCHEMHHTRIAPLSLRILREENLDYAFEVLGAYAGDYLQRRYAGEDARVEARMMADVG